MEQTACALCGADKTTLLFEGRDEWYKLPGTFPTVRCRECGLIYLNPRPGKNEINQYYPPEYTPYFVAIEDEPSWWTRFNRRYALRKRLKAISTRIPKRGRVLDVGCATGTFLAALKEDGWQTYGVELNKQAAEYARSRHQLNVFTGELTEAQFSDSQFDLIIFWDVLEHVHKPRKTLQEAARITKPGGYLFLVLPNPESWEARLFGQYWAGWDTPRHLYIYSKNTMHRFLAETGWQMTEMFCITGRIWLFNLSLEHWLQNNWRHTRTRKIIMSIARSLPMRILSLPYFMLAERLKKGSVMAIVAQRSRE